MDYIIKQTYTLPSKGLVYATPVNPEVELTSMTTNHEMLRLQPSELVYKNMCDIIDDCIVNDIGISSYDMGLFDYQFLLHKLRVVTYGPDYKLSSRCPYCGMTNEDTINLDDIEVFEYTEDLDKYLSFDLPVSKMHIDLAVQTPRMLDDIQSRVKEIRKKSNNKGGDPSIYVTICKLVDKIDGKDPNQMEIEKWARNLPMRDTNTILQYADTFNKSIGINMTLENICDVCGLTYFTKFQMTSEFFRPTLDI